MTVYSMTAFAAATADHELGRVSWEARALNSRYLDLIVKLPEPLRAIESQVRSAVKRRIHRGKLELGLRWQPTYDAAATLELNTVMAAQLRQFTLAIADDSALKPGSASSFLNWPGLIKSREADLSAVQPVALAGLDSLLDKLQQERAREGEAIVELLRQRLDDIATQAAIVRPLIPELRVLFADRIATRAEELRTTIEPERLAQEVAFLLQKSDVAEELDRLDTHVAELRQALDGEGPHGRRVDFLVQELHREANTLGSKSTHVTMSQVTVELKVLIEQLREQAQNIE